MKKTISILIICLILFASIEANAQWVKMPSGMRTNNNITSLAALRNYIFAVTVDYGVYLSNNNGYNWTYCGLIYPISVLSLAVSGNNIFAGTSGSGIYLSTNNGTSWTQTSLGNRDISSLLVSGNNIFAGTADSGVYLSTNNALSWVSKNQGFSGNIGESISALLIANNYIFAGTSGNSVWRRSYTEITEIKHSTELVPADYSLSQNYPNTFNPSTNIRYDLPKSSFVKLVVFDMLGKEIETLVSETQSADTYEATLNALQLTSGVYFYKLQTEGYTEAKKMVLEK